MSSRNALVATAAVSGALLAVGCGDALEPADAVVPTIEDPCGFADCGPMGICMEQNGKPSCLCDLGYAGTACDRCASSFHRNAVDRCVPDRECADLDENPCGEFGTCIDVEGIVACECDIGYEGPRCELCEASYGRDNQGRCLPLQLGGGDGDASISCAAGYVGPACTRCAFGYHPVAGDRCALDEYCTSSSCPVNAECQATGGEIECTCLPGFSGHNCFQCAPGFHAEGDGCVEDEICEGDTCPPNATCRVVDGQALCPCDPGYEGEACGSCERGYHRDPSSQRCVPDQACEPGGCPDNAGCAVIEGAVQCSCDPGYVGPSCDRCDEGFFPEGGNCRRNEYCQAGICDRHEVCRLVQGRAVCECAEGWNGPGCGVCSVNVTESTGFEFPSGWGRITNNCRTRLELSVAGMTFASRVRPNGEKGLVQACAPNVYADMPTQHIQLQMEKSIHEERPAVITFDRPAYNVSFTFGAMFEELEVDIRAQEHPSMTLREDGETFLLDIDPNAPTVGTINFAPESSGKITIRLEPPARVLSLWSRGSGVPPQTIAIDDISYSYPECE